MRTEKILGIIFLVGLIFKLLHWPVARLILVISLSIIAVLYFLTAFYFFCDKVIKRQNLPFSIVSGLFLSMIPLGILFKSMNWPGGQIFLLIGTISAPVILIISYLLKTKTTEDLATYYKNMVTRTAVWTVLTILFYFLPITTLINN